MARSEKRVGYVVAVVASTLVLLARLAMNDILAEQARLMPFVLAVMAAAWIGGLGPGLAATLLDGLLGLFFIVPPQFSLRIDTLADSVNLVLFLVIGCTISILCEALHSAQRRETEKQFQTLANSIPQLVWMARPDGYRFWFNKRWYEYTGSTTAKSEGIGWQHFHDPTVLPSILDKWEAAQRSPENLGRTLTHCDATTVRCVGSWLAPCRFLMRAVNCCTGSGRQPTYSTGSRSNNL